MTEMKMVFSQKLDIDPDEFVAVWNDTPECRDIAEAQLTHPATTQFADPSILGAVVEFVASTGSVQFATGAIAGGILHDTLKAGVKICLAKMKTKITALKALRSHFNLRFGVL
ncbi:MAG TPA: hypothetical protein DCM38_03445 [Gammaproteobacteria bacterium]|nr:hypothetical protein [Gammaproteobacteria bacterium]